LTQIGHDVTILTSSRGLPAKIYNNQVDGVGHVIRYPERFAIVEVPVVPQIPSRLLLAEKNDVIHVHGMTPSQTDLSLLFLRLKGAKAVYTHHFDPETRGGHLTEFYSFFGRSVLKFANTIVASTQSYAQSSPFLKPYLGRVRIIPMGVDTNRFNNNRKNPYLLETNPELMRFEKKILFVGKLIYYKGPRFLLEAFANLKTKDVCLMFVGEGSEKKQLIQLANHFRVSERVFFMGAVADSTLPFLYTFSDVLVLPSVTRREAFGIVILEAMASGKPVVASAIPGVSDVVEHGRTGYLVPPANSTALARAIDTILEHSSTARLMGDTARQITRTKYDWEKVFAKYLQLYED
jgi:rhamnosyl/mannosyltransferase